VEFTEYFVIFVEMYFVYLCFIMPSQLTMSYCSVVK